MVSSDSFLQIEATIGEGIDRLVGRQTRSIGVKCQVVVLVIVANAGEFLDHWDTRALQDLCITDARALQDQRRSVCSSRNNNHLPRANGSRRLLRHHELRVWLRLGVRLVLNPNSTLVIVEQDFNHLLVADDVKVGILAAPQFRVDVPVGRILSSTIGTDVLHPALRAVVGVEILQVLELAVSQSVGGLDERVFGALAAVGAAGNVYWAFKAMHLFLAVAVVCFELSWLEDDQYDTVKVHTFFRKGSSSSADQPLVFQESKSCRCPLESSQHLILSSEVFRSSVQVLLTWYKPSN
jgi:hypothetical protein